MPRSRHKDVDLRKYNAMNWFILNLGLQHLYGFHIMLRIIEYLLRIAKFDKYNNLLRTTIWEVLPVYHSSL